LPEKKSKPSKNVKNKNLKAKNCFEVFLCLTTPSYPCILNFSGRFLLGIQFTEYSY